MKLTRRTLTSVLALSAALSVAGLGGVAQAADVKIALVVKSLGNGFFEAANKGAQEAAKDLGGVEIIYTGPTSTTAEGQIEVINSLIAQGVDAIAISANDPDAVVPALKRRRSAASRSSPGIPAWHLKAAFCSSTPRPTR